jgi:hypothetical protein
VVPVKVKIRAIYGADMSWCSPSLLHSNGTK